MIKALIALLVFGGAAVLCFWRAYKVQTAHGAIDGIVRGRVYSRLYLWVLAGTMFVVMALIVSFSAIEPAFMSVGRR